MTAALPHVGVVVVHYHQSELTLRCLRQLAQGTYPSQRRHVVVVDNGSAPDFHALVTATDPDAIVVAAGSNLGFGGGSNLGIRTLRRSWPELQHVALLNNDALPEPAWLEPLIAAVSGGERVGAATPKVLLLARHAELRLRSTPRVMPGDPRELGVQLSGALVQATDAFDAMPLPAGGWGWEDDPVSVGGRFTWTTGEAVVHLPVAVDDATVGVKLRLSCGGLGQTDLQVIGGAEALAVEVGSLPMWVAVSDVRTHETINNTGTVLLPDGDVTDRGFLEPDDGRFDEPQEVFGWSGAAVLLSCRYLDDVGLFDDSFFLYFEDADLSWRGRLRGWRYCYVPDAVVRHAHSATVGEGSPLAQHLVARNRVLTIVKNGPRTLVRAALRQLVQDAVGAVWRDVVSPLRRARRPVWGHAADAFRLAASVGRRLAPALRARRSIRRTAQVEDHEILRWATRRSHGQLRIDGSARSRRPNA